MQKLRPSKSSKCCEHPNRLPKDVDSSCLSTTHIQDALFNTNFRPVCPQCGQYNIKCLDYGMTETSDELFFTDICLTCNTVFRYKTKRLIRE